MWLLSEVLESAWEKKRLSCSSKKYDWWIVLPKPLLLSDLLFVPLYSTWSSSLHPCLMSELSRGHIYHAEQLWCTQIYAEDGICCRSHGGITPLPPEMKVQIVLLLRLWRSHVGSGDMIDVKHLSRRLSRSAAISNLYWIDLTSIGPLVVYKK